jgi:signal transduction histidine kinase/ActR/RegA family two-component response regulator
MAGVAAVSFVLTAEVAGAVATAVVLALIGAFWFARGDDAARDAPRPGQPPQDAAARIRELQETVDELTRARAAALEAANRRDEFLLTISHELRSPLNAILGWTQVLEPRPDLPADVSDALHVIRRNALRQRQLLDDLVDMSRVVSGALRIEPRPMRIAEALDEACQSVRPDMERKGVRLDCGPACPALVSADARRLQQVLRNLLSNAIRFTPSGGTISLRAVRQGADVAISVTDTGVGIDPGFLPHVFEPYRQQPGGGPRDQTTFGLGLALAHIIIVGHGGRVTAHSEGGGRGATFVVTLPALDEHASQRISGPHEIAAAAPATPLAGVSVLAVDDEPDWRELLGHILGSAGADARIAGSAAEALQILESWRPDVVLTDIAMPTTDGYGLLAAIRSRGGAARAVPVVAMTAHAGTPERTRTARAGFAEHLAKPIPPAELIDAVRRVVEQSPRAKGAGSG